MKNELPRRKFLKVAALTGAGVAFFPEKGLSDSWEPPLVACQQYTWFSYFQRAGMDWGKDMDASLNALTSAGFKGYEPSFSDASEVDALNTGLSKKKIWAKSMYVNSTLHEKVHVDESITSALDIAGKAKKMGVEIVVTNPSPIQWGKPLDKDDVQLEIQAKALNELGGELRKMGMKLAYHNHDMEMRQSAREFHHMMVGTDPQNVHLCLDAHWIYRGAGNSQTALFDIIKLYADRVVEIHIRQSVDGIWSEVFGEGDIDYHRLADEFNSRNMKPHLVLEQAVEDGTPYTRSAEEALSASLNHVYRVFDL